MKNVECSYHRRGAGGNKSEIETVKVYPVPESIDPGDTVAVVGLICQRMEDGTPVANVPWVATYHSPDGFEWGYRGSGPADLALNVLCALLPQVEMIGIGCPARVPFAAMEFHQRFKEEVIANMPKAGGWVKLEALDNWLGAHGLTRREG
mgnify:CR=1 FL=1